MWIGLKKQKSVSLPTPIKFLSSNYLVSIIFQAKNHLCTIYLIKPERYNLIILYIARSAGDCLLDSVMQATWGVFDRDNTLRRALAESLVHAGHA